MGRLALLGAAMAAVLGVVNLTGAGVAPAAAGGNPGKPSPPGQAQTPPGQQKTPPGQAAKSTAEPAPEATAPEGDENGRLGSGDGAAPVDPKPEHGPRRPASPPGRAEPTGSLPAKSVPAQRSSSVAHEHVIICHRTGSDSNPYVVINISSEAWVHGHTTHPELDGRSDIVLKRGARPGEKLPVSACGHPGGGNTPGPTGTTPGTPPSHAGDPGSSSASPVAVTEASHGNGGPGAAARLGATAVKGKLPFTGLPLWVVVLAASALLGTGLALRRSFRTDS